MAVSVSQPALNLREVMTEVRALRNRDTWWMKNLNFSGQIIGGTDIINIGGGQIYKDASGNVGIGTPTPGAKLHVVGTTFAYGNGAAALDWGDTTSVGRLTFSGSDAYVNATSGALVLLSNNTERMRIDSAGNVGIGTTTPGQRLEVANAGGSNTYIKISDVNNSDVRFGIAGSGEAIFYTADAKPMLFSTNGSERVRIDSAGNVGIGTSTPSGTSKLTIHDGAYASYRAENNVGGYALFGVSNDATSDVFIDGTNDLQIRIGGSEKARIDASGNLGLGVVPSAWGPTWRGIDIEDATGGSVISSLYPMIASNSYNNGTTGWLYKTTGPSTRYQQDTGQHRWYTAPSGTAGATVPFTQAMALDNSGNLALGRTSATPYGSTTFSLDGPAGSYVDFYYNGTRTGLIDAGNGTFGLDTTTGVPLIFSTVAVERMRLDTSGNLLVGTTSIYPYTLTGGSGINVSASGEIQCAGTNCFAGNNTTSGGGNVAKWFNQGAQVGSITVTASATAYNTTSDRRLKTAIADATDAGGVIDLMKVRQFDWRANGAHQRFGFIAQELGEVFPEAVTVPNDPDQMQSVDYSKLVPMLTKEIQSLRRRVAQLEAA